MVKESQSTQMDNPLVCWKVLPFNNPVLPNGINKKPKKGILKESLNNGLEFGDELGREVVEKIKGKQEPEPDL